MSKNRVERQKAALSKLENKLKGGWYLKPGSRSWQVKFCDVSYRPAWSTEFQYIQGYTEKSCLRKLGGRRSWVFVCIRNQICIFCIQKQTGNQGLESTRGNLSVLCWRSWFQGGGWSIGQFCCLPQCFNLKCAQILYASFSNISLSSPISCMGREQQSSCYVYFITDLRP